MPISRTCLRICSEFNSTLNPGILSNLSSVPPVWPKPLPEIIGTLSPQAASAGARTRDTLSPTPPVECLSTTSCENVESHDMISPESLIASVRAIVSASLIPSLWTCLSQDVRSSSEIEPSTTPSTRSRMSSDITPPHLVRFESLPWCALGRASTGLHL